MQFDGRSGFVCLERKGAENYPSQDKAVLFFEVADVARAINAIGLDRIVGSDLTVKTRAKWARPPEPRRRWAVIHDPEGHNILLLESCKPRKRKAPRRPRSR